MRILFVAMADSTHTACWISQLHSESWDLHLFPAHDTGVHPGIAHVTVHGILQQRRRDVHPSLRQTGIWWPFRRGRNQLTRWVRSSKSTMGAAQHLARTIKALEPTLIHTLEMQRGGYLTLAARELIGADAFPPWIFSCWGNDLYLFGRQPQHESRVRSVLEGCDFFTADCRRDLMLARDFGFRGCEIGVFPGPGGFDIGRMRRFQYGRPSSRNLIAIKGYHDDVYGGRALVALDALRLCAGALSGYSIAIYNTAANGVVGMAAKELARLTGLDITVLPAKPRDEFLRMLGQARVAVGLSLSDGTPNTMLEAMIMGAFPVQSDTISTGEWIDDGRNGFLVPPEDPAAVANAIRRAIADDALVDRAAELNDTITRQHVDMSVVKPRVIEMYRRVAEWRGQVPASRESDRRSRELEVLSK